MKILNYDTFPEWIGQISLKNIENDKYQDMLLKITKFEIIKNIAHAHMGHTANIEKFAYVYFPKHLTYEYILKLGTELKSKFNKVWLYSSNTPTNYILISDYDYIKHGKPPYIRISLFTQ